MNSNHKENVPEGRAAHETATPPTRTSTQGCHAADGRTPTTPKLAIHFGRRMSLALLAICAMAGVYLIPVGQASAQTFTALHSFTNTDGASPYAGLTQGNNGIFYGTASLGGSSGLGTVFAVNADGTGFTILYSFTGSNDGANPWAGLVLLGNTLYGTSYRGGTGYGTVFALNTDGTGFTNLHTFTGSSDGANPNAALILSGNTLYGTAAYGGSWGAGTVFALSTDGTGFTNLHIFTPTVLQRFYGFDQFGQYYVEMHINTDGAVPVAGLILSGNTLYGTTSGGGSGGNGTVFAVTTDGTGFTPVHNFEQTGNLTRHPIGGPGPGPGPGGCTGSSCPPGAQCIGGACACRGFCGGA